MLTIISNIQSILKIPWMRNLTSEGKVIVFKTLALSKIYFVHQLNQSIIEEIEIMEKKFLWNHSAPKIKHSTQCDSFATGGLRNICINTKIVSLQCLWIKPLYGNSFHEWKLIPFHFINITITPAFKFHQSLALSFQLVLNLTKTFQFWSTCFPLCY